VGETTSEVLDGRYRLKRPIARVTAGGFVYAAEHLFTRKPAAIKLLDPSVPDIAHKRVRREMEALATVQGPGVVDFRDGGESDGRVYLVLELLEGRTLAGLLVAKHTLAVEQAVRVAAELADVLARCHERGVAHRDVKPANVFVRADERVELLDFGIAKLLRDDRPAERLTRENTLIGTPEYMAPEALLSSPDVGAQADQYGVGVVLYECLTGAVPFDGMYPEVLRKVSTSRPRSVRETRADVPPVLDDVVLRALARDPEARYPSVAAFGDALRAAVRGTATACLFDHHSGDASRKAATIADSPIAKARSGASRRRHARAPYVTLARVRVESGEHVDGRIEEISESGFQFVGTRPIPDGASIVIRFALPISGRIVETSATSRWSRSTRGLTAAGFELAGLPDEPLGEIRRYVALMCSE